MARGESSSSASLAPGFRFHPTDEELVRYYLKRKVTNKPFRFDPISVIDIYKSEPWDLPGKSKLKTRDLEWYFFGALDRKYGNGSKTNRATENGYWKTTGKDRPIRSNTKMVGMKKTLVYHIGRAPRGERTNWVMHEYRLADEDLDKAEVVQDGLVLCRIFQKSGTGPKNGEQYGAPFVEEEWDDDEELVLPGEEMAVADEVLVGEDAYLEPNELHQNLDNEIVSENVIPPSSFYYEDTSNYVEHPRNSCEDDQKPIIRGGETRYGSDLLHNQNFSDLPGQYGVDAEPLHGEYVTELSNDINVVAGNYFLDESYLDAVDNPPFDEGFFLEADDLSKPVEPDTTRDSTGFDMVDEYLSFFDAADDNLTFDPSEIMGSDDAVSDGELPSQKDMMGGTEEAFMTSQKLLQKHNSTDASSSQQKPDAMKFEPDKKYPFIKQASHLLGNIPAPPAFASEFPMKDAAIRLNSASSSSIRISAGMIRIESITLGDNGMDQPLGKTANINIVLSFSLLQGNVGSVGSVPMAGTFSGKTGTVASRGWLFIMLFWVLILSVSFKIGTYVCTK